jgi:polyribonucleotide 5'-hydroxyl-kinase
LVVGNTYIFTDTKAAIYTWQGCAIEVSGDAVQSEYTAQETPMNEYINIHFALESIREQAKAADTPGPRLLVLGPEDAGKTTLAKILTAYAVRSQRSPVVVNLDLADGVLSLPGTLTATVFKSLIDIEEGWGTAPMSGPNGAIPVKLPLVYYHGHQEPAERQGKVYKSLISRLALAVTGRMSQDAEAREAGLIIDTPGVLAASKSDGAVYTEILSHIISEFSINCIVCLGSERLYSDMTRRYDGQPVSSTTSPSTIAVIKATKSGGVVDRDDAYMASLRAAQIRSYFYGNLKLSNGVSLQPRQQQVDFAALTVWLRIGSFPAGTLTSSTGLGADPDEEDEFLPGDFNPDPAGPSNATVVPLPSSQVFERVTLPQPAMRSCVLAVMTCPADSDQDAIRDAPVEGFLYVTDVDVARGKISLLSPVVGRIMAEKALVWAGWPEGVLGMA